MGALYDHYQQRVIAFDHLTVSKDPEQNARDFLTALKEAAPERTFDFDILCHSRGGIVSRTLAERGREVFPELNARFGKVYFVATPNSGSPLGDPRHVVEMLDVFTNLLTAFPDGPVLYTIEVFLAIVKLLAYAAGTKLPGIAAMGPQKGSYIAKLLNRGGKASKLYAAASADYTPDPKKDNAFFNGRFANYILDRVFGGAANDLIVPEAGVYTTNGHKAFPIENVLSFGTEDRVWHTDFFRQPRTLDHIGRHFGIPALETALTPEVGARTTVPPITREVEEPEPSYRTTVLRGIPIERTPIPTRGITGGLSGYRSPGGGNVGVGAYTSYATPPTRGGRTTRGGAAKVPPYRTVPSTTARKKPAKKSPKVAAPEELKRQPFIDFKEKVQVGVAVPLIVLLKEAVPKARVDEILTLTLPAGEDHVEMVVTLTASGFDVTPEGEVTMKVYRERDPKLEKVRFKLTARDLGPEPEPREITAEFWLGATCVGSVTHRTVVVPKGHDFKDVAGDGSSNSHLRSVRLPQEPREDCDLVVYVEGHDRPGESPFNVRLNIDLPGRAAYRRVGQLALPGGSLSQYIDSFFNRHFNQFPSGGTAAAVKKWESQFALGLASLGKILWTFLPQDFRTEYFALHEAGALPRSILVNSDEMVFPWELVIPNEVIRGKQEVLDPLGAAHVLGRWKPDMTYRPEPQRLPVKNFCVLNPKYPAGDDLPWSAQEIAELKVLFPKLTVLPKADADTVRKKLLERSDIQILHYSGHGDYDPQNADLNHLILENGDTLDALTLGRAKLTAEGQPILYLNACSSGQTAIAAGRMGGFASLCLTGGCSGIIAPYWPVKDDSAKEFSLGLYRKLKGGLAIGEALQELRRDNPDNPTFLAYSYFGDPWARVLF